MWRVAYGRNRLEDAFGFEVRGKKQRNAKVDASLQS